MHKNEMKDLITTLSTNLNIFRCFSDLIIRQGPFCNNFFEFNN